MAARLAHGPLLGQEFQWIFLAIDGQQEGPVIPVKPIEQDVYVDVVPDRAGLFSRPRVSILPQIDLFAVQVHVNSVSGRIDFYYKGQRTTCG